MTNRLTIAMLVVFPIAWLTDKIAWLTCPAWRDISRGNPR